MIYKLFFLYILHFLLLTNICISQERQTNGKTNLSTQEPCSIIESENDHSNLKIIIHEKSSEDGKFTSSQNNSNDIQSSSLDIQENLIHMPLNQYIIWIFPNKFFLVQSNIIYIQLVFRKCLTIQNENISSNQGNIMNTADSGNNKKYKLENVLLELQRTLIHLQKELYYSPSERGYSTAHYEVTCSNTGSLMQTENLDTDDLIKLQNISYETQETILHLQKHLHYCLLERQYINKHKKMSPKEDSIISSEHSKQDESTSVQSFINEATNISPTFQIESHHLPLERIYSDNQYESISSHTGSSTNTENSKEDELIELQNIFFELEHTQPYMEMDLCNLPLEHCSNIHDEDMPINIEDMFPESPEQFKLFDVDKILCELQDESFDFEDKSINLPTEKQFSTNLEKGSKTSSVQSENLKDDVIGLQKNSSSLLTEQKHLNTSRCKYPRSTSGIKRKYEKNKIDKSKKPKIDNTNDINKKKRSKRNLNTSRLDTSNLKDENIFKTVPTFIQYVIEEILETKLDNLSNTILNLQKIFSNLEKEHNKLTMIINEKIDPLKNIIRNEIKNAHKAYLHHMELHSNTYSGNNEYSSEDIYNFMLLFKKHMRYTFKGKERVHNSVKDFLKFAEDFKHNINIFNELSEKVANIMDNLTYNKIFLIPQILSKENSEVFFKILDSTNDIIKEAKESLKEGLLLKNYTKIEEVQQNITFIRNKIFPHFANSLQKIFHLLKSLNISRKNNNMLLQNMLYFLDKENTMYETNIKEFFKNHKEYTLKGIESFLLEERKCISESYNEAHKSLKLGLTEKHDINLKVLMKDPEKEKILSDMYKTFVELLKIAYFRKNLKILYDMTTSIIGKNSKKYKKYFMPKSTTVMTHETKNHLLSQLQVEEQKLRKLKSNVEHIFYFDNLRKSIINIGSLNIKKKTENIIAILQSVDRILENDKKNENKDKKLVKTEHILFALFFANLKINAFTLENKK
ncbi:hypothetical protein PRELSG_0030900 [Plasmodium relictum]|uniref:Fam-j protein n=1 Tax=Plasmodium relictum TaxID=85471 RepID=A0A1J1GNC3_PLARL|nr:hypothetical protein PRELSG_0030900 [Plasmodium relictum]CRG84974.1 hypothetical protein PRELSG_0030900 [Plasmodium relictum]